MRSLALLGALAACGGSPPPGAPPPTTRAADVAADAPAPTPEERLARGWTVYESKGCATCHTTDGTPRVGPSWLGLWGAEATLSDGRTVRVDADYVRRSLDTPQAFARPGYEPVMPSYAGVLSDEDVEGLLAVLASLATPAR